MDNAVLVGDAVEAGKRLIEELDRIGFSVVSALWFHDPDEGQWRFIVASNEVVRKDSREAYKKILRVIRDHPDISVGFDDVILTNPNDELIRLLRRDVHTGPGLEPIRYSKNAINNVFIDDAIIYRLQ
jgi:hypothetical protein